MDYSMQGFPVLHHLPEFAQIHVHWISNAIQPSHPLLPPSLPALNLSQNQGLFQWVRSLPQIVKVLELHLQSFQWIFRSVSFRIDWFDLLAVQGTLRSLLQHHSSKAYICCCSCIHTYMLSCVQLCVTPWTVARQAPLSMGFSSQEYWSGLPCPPPEKAYIFAHYKCLFCQILYAANWTPCFWKILFMK